MDGKEEALSAAYEARQRMNGTDSLEEKRAISIECARKFARVASLSDDATEIKRHLDNAEMMLDRAESLAQTIRDTARGPSACGERRWHNPAGCHYCMTAIEKTASVDWDGAKP